MIIVNEYIELLWIENIQGRERHYAIIPHSYSAAFKAEFPEVEDACRVLYFPQNNILIKQGEDIQEEKFLVWADSNFFDVFTFPMLVGDPKTALKEPNSLILTENMAIKYFGQNWKEDNILGQVLDFVGNDNDPQITGVMQNIPSNSHFKGDLFMSSTSLNFLEQPNYLGFSAYTYLLLNEGSSPDVVEAKIPQLVVDYASGQILENFGVDYAQYQKNGNGYRYFLQPITGIYLDSNLEGEMKPPGSRNRVYFFSLIALMIIAIAAINFMNLSTARSATRAREVGIRKTLGSERKQLIMQFLFEASIIAVIAGALALILATACLPYFNELSGKTLQWDHFFSPLFLVVFIGIILFTGLLSGIYPAVFLSGFHPLQAIRGRLMKNTGGLGLRNGLVVFQFSISIFLIATTIMVYRQLKFTQDKDLGFDKDSVINLQNAFAIQSEESETFKNELEQIPGVLAVGGCSNQAGDNFPGTSWRPSGQNETTTGSIIFVDDGFIECMKMDMVEGRHFSKEFADSSSVMINEAVVQEMGLTDPIGKILTSTDNFLNSDPENPTEYTIVGVVEDYHFQSLHHEITPLFFVHNYRNFNAGADNLMAVRLETNSINRSLQNIENLWKEFAPETPFRFAFLDQQWAQLYEQEITSRKVFSLFSLLAIFIACLGLLALANYMTEQRLKEIGIRKVLGATVPGIVSLLSKNFLKLVILSIVIATPLSFLFLRNWLESFAYRSNLSWWIFAAAGASAILIAGLTVSYTSIQAALSNPMKSLKSD